MKFPILVTNLKEEWKCFHCGTQTTYYDSLGKYECKTHTGGSRYNFKTHRNERTCCGKPIDDSCYWVPNSCTLCDHSPHPLEYGNPRIPVTLANKLPNIKEMKKEPIIVNHPDGSRDYEKSVFIISRIKN